MTVAQVVDRINSMRVGQCYALDRHDMADIPTSILTGEPPFSQIMSRVVGGAWEFIIEKNCAYGDIRIERITSDGLRRHVDYDREHLYQKDSAGTYHLND